MIRGRKWWWLGNIAAVIALIGGYIALNIVFWSMFIAIYIILCIILVITLFIFFVMPVVIQYTVFHLINFWAWWYNDAGYKKN